MRLPGVLSTAVEQLTIDDSPTAKVWLLADYLQSLRELDIVCGSRWAFLDLSPWLLMCKAVNPVQHVIVHVASVLRKVLSTAPKTHQSAAGHHGFANVGC